MVSGPWTDRSSAPAKTTDKRKREDISGRNEERSAATEYTTVKCYLSGIIRDLAARPNWKEDVRTAFENRCVAVSKMMVRGSLLLRLFVEGLSRETGDGRQRECLWPDFSKDILYVQLLRKGSDARKPKAGSTHPVLQKVWNSDLVQNTIARDTTVKRYCYDYNVINYAARGLKTCFEKNLRMHFKTRQERAIGAWLVSNGIDKKFARAVQRRINGWSHATDRTAEEEPLLQGTAVESMISRHRRVLEDPGTLYTDTCDLRTIINYYFFLKREFSDVEKIRRFAIVPRHKIGVHHATFDQTGIRGICKELKIWEEPREEDVEDETRRGGWHLLLDTEKIKKMKPKWNLHYLQTDGIAASILFSRPATAAKDGKDGTSEKEDGGRGPAAKRRRKHASKGASGSDAQGAGVAAAVVNAGAEYVIGIDPGRTNVVTCSVVDVKTSKVLRKLRMTAKQYYQESWMTDRRKKVTDRARKSNEPYKRALEAVSSGPAGEDEGVEDEVSEERGGITCSGGRFEKYLVRLYANYPVLWRERAKKKYRKCDMKVYSRKQRCIADFVNRLIPPKSDVTRYHVAFGAAKFAATGKGEHFSSPARTLGRAIRRRVGGDARFSPVGENYTSRVCHRCHQPLNKLVKGCFSIDRGFKEGSDRTATAALRENRDTRRCAMGKSFEGSATSAEEQHPHHQRRSAGCPLGGRYVDRDYNASTNMAHKLLGLWTEELLTKRDKMPLRYYFVKKKKSQTTSELPGYRIT